MKSKRNISKQKKINPRFWVFCEGKTEEAYVSFLRSKFRLSIEIISKVSGHSISKAFIDKYKQGKPKHVKDKNFLIFDADLSEIIEKLKQIDNAKLIISNPSIEFWFLLHYKNQKHSISEENCIKDLENRNKTKYKKGFIDKCLKEKLETKYTEACKRALKLTLFTNPSTNMYEFIEELEIAKRKKT